MTITSTLQGQFVYWKGMEPSELLYDSTRLVAYIQDLPYQEGRPLASITEGQGRTLLVDYNSSSSEYSLESQVCMASIHDHAEDNDESGREYDNELLAEVSTDEDMANALLDEDEEHRRVRKVKNAKRAKRRQNTEALARQPPQHDFNGSRRPRVRYSEEEHC
jgi:hypothetical protein